MQNHLNLKEYPVSEQPYSKFERLGPSALSDAELLAIVIKSGTKEKTAVEIARELLQGAEENILNLYALPLERLMQIPGIGKVKAIQLKAIAELSRRINQTNYKRGIFLTSPDSLANYYMESMRHEQKEIVLAAYFDNKCAFLKDKVLTIGGRNYSVFPIAEIIRLALECNAAQIAVLHNHPSGDPCPSGDDIKSTKNLKEAAKLFELQLADHVIIGDKRYYSFLEHGLL